MKSNKLKCWLAAVVVAVICCPVALAQQSKIAVASFNRMETDITARVTAPKKDQNGEVCALIRIVTNVKDLMFEPDALGITARENKIGEIWLYVPRGARRISILHDQLGILRNYFYPDIIEKRHRIRNGAEHRRQRRQARCRKQHAVLRTASRTCQRQRVCR